MKVDELKTHIDTVVQTIPFIPPWVWSTAMLLAAGALALLLHRFTLRLAAPLLRPDGAGRPRAFALTFITATSGPSRLAMVVVALGGVLPLTSFSTTTMLTIGHALLVAFIVLVGWSATRAFEIAATLYLHRFRTDVDDNLTARKHLTQVRVLKRAFNTLLVLLTVAVALMTFQPVRQFGLSLLASAGAASLVVGLAARPLLSNLIAGVQIAITQPIRLEDAVIVENEWGWIEEIASTYVVVRLWDWRRMVLPISYFLEKPFQNWTRDSASLIGSVFLYLDYTVPVEAVREKLTEIARASDLWDGQVVNLQVSDAKSDVIELRALVSARNAPRTWDLRCEVREKLIAFLQRDYPHCLPRSRVILDTPPPPPPAPGPAVGGAAVPASENRPPETLRAAAARTDAAPVG